MTFTVVLDVNVLASAAATEKGVPGLLVDCAVEGMYRLSLSDHILRTLDDVLRRPYFAQRLGHERRTRFLAKLEDAASMVKAAPSVVGVCDDEEDDLVLGTAVTAGADYLVTGDRGLLRVGAYGGVSMITAREFLVLLRT